MTIFDIASSQKRRVVLQPEAPCSNRQAILQAKVALQYAICNLLFHAARVYSEKIGRDVHTHMKIIYLQRTSSDVLLSR